MWMDDGTKQALLWAEVWDRFRPLTPMGQQAKRSLPPFLPGEEAAWQASLARQETLSGTINDDPDWAERVEGRLRKLPDPGMVLLHLERGGAPGITDWFRLKQFLWHVRGLGALLNEKGLTGWLSANPSEWTQTFRLLNPSQREEPGFSLDQGYDPHLTALAKRLDDLDQRRRLVVDARASEIERDYGIRRGREGEWAVDRTLPILNRMRQDPRLDRVRETPFETVFRPLSSPEEEALAEEAASLEKEREELVQDVLEILAVSVRPFGPFLTKALEEVTHFDLAWAKVRAAMEWRGVRPRPSMVFSLEDGVHPVLQDRLQREEKVFTPVCLRLDQGMTVLIGPNMGGKTVALRTLGVVAALGQYGFLVPTRACSMPLFPWITAIIGDAQNPEAGLSTFGAEAAHLAHWLREPEAGLLLLDEIGRGTNPVEGAALSAAVTRYLATGEGWSVHATHYREVLDVSGIRAYRTGGLRNAESPPVGGEDQGSLHDRMDFRLYPWQPSDGFPREALAIAAALGLPKKVIREAKARIDDREPRCTELAEHDNP
ncbi:lysine 5,6-aminomutase reactivase ATPase KamC [Salinithrix halophila]|uniref:MutS domain V n=1 Tax=Salinithrix halophila TaxID=1485204 RepID=A0ABV8JEB7_9BACL